MDRPHTSLVFAVGGRRFDHISQNVTEPFGIGISRMADDVSSWKEEVWSDWKQLKDL